jgi:ribonuclease D
VTGECEQFRARPQGDADPRLAWTRIKEARHLRGAARNCARELAAWRERTARHQDQPVRFILSDLALVGVAQKAPKDTGGLRKVRGLDGRHRKNGAAEQILDAGQRAKDSPDEIEDTTVVEPPAQVERRLRPAVTLVSAWISQVARDEKLDPAQLATRNDIVEYLAQYPNARLRSGWRREIAGDRITGLVNGDLALAFDDGELVLVPRPAETL